MGSAAVLEFTVLPKGKKMASILEPTNIDMAIARMDWTPQEMFHFESSKMDKGSEVQNSDLSVGNLAMSLSGKKRNDAFTNDFQSAVGGLKPQIEAIVRRVLDGRSEFTLLMTCIKKRRRNSLVILFQIFLFRPSFPLESNSTS